MSPEDFLTVMSRSYTQIIVILGVIICLAGLLKMLFAKGLSWSGVAIIFLGGVLAGIPHISKASFGKDGFEIVTNLNEATEGLAVAVQANGSAIENLRDGLTAVERLATQLASNNSSSSGSTRLSRENLAILKSSISKADSEISKLEASTDNIAQQLQKNDVLIRQFSIGQ
jgi:hypothetical protein